MTSELYERPDVWTPVFGTEQPNSLLLPDMQVQMLTEMSRIHEFTYNRTIDLERGDRSRFDEYDREQSFIVDRIVEWYKLICTTRIQYQRMIMNSEAMLAAEKERCADDHVWFINMWLWIQEPRVTELKTSYGQHMPAKLPFIMYPGQQRVVDEIDYCYQNRLPFIIAKSREAGISWAGMAIMLKYWLFTKEWRGGVASEKQDKVDIVGLTDPLLGKFRYMLYNLPNAFRPSGYRADKLKSKTGKNNAYDKLLALKNNDNEAEIIGQTGSTIGEGGRCSIFLIDEEQNLTNPEEVNVAMESVTNCRGGIGTSRGMNHFGKKWKSGGVHKISVMWHEDPRKVGLDATTFDFATRSYNKPANYSSPWRKLIEHQNRATPEVIAQAYDMDWAGSETDLCIDPKWVASAVGFECQGIDQGPKHAGFDVAGSGSDKAIYIARKGQVAQEPVDIGFKEVTQNMLGAHNRAKEEGVSAMVFDQNAIGESMYGLITKVDEEIPYEILGVKGQESASTRLIPGENIPANEKYYNLRCELWMNLRTLFRNTYEHREGIMEHAPDEMISIPNNPELIEQLCYPKLLPKNGKWIIESKEAMKKRGISSPDIADALAYCFYDGIVGKARALPSFTRSSMNDHFVTLDLSENKSDWNYTIGMVRNKSSELYSVMIRWSKIRMKIQIVAEYSTRTFMPSDHKTALTDILPGIKVNGVQYVVPERVFDDIDKGLDREYQEYKQARIKPTCNYGDDPRGTLLMLDRLFQLGGAQISVDCKQLVSQVMQFDMGFTTVDDRYGFVSALLVAVQNVDRKTGKQFTRIASKNSQGYSKKQKKVASSVLEKILSS